MTKVEPTTEMVTTAKALVASDKAVSVADILKALSVAQTSAKAPAKIPVAAKITEEQSKDLAEITKIFGGVVPAERRKLTTAEVDLLIEERTMISRIEKFLKNRRDDISVTMHNHFDVVAEDSGDSSEAITDAKGHYIIAQRSGSENTANEFSREISESAPTLPISALEGLKDDGKIDNKTFLAMTTQVRVVDENKVMAVIKKDQSIMPLIASVATAGRRSTSMYVRAKK